MKDNNRAIQHSERETFSREDVALLTNNWGLFFSIPAMLFIRRNGFI